MEGFTVGRLRIGLRIGAVEAAAAESEIAVITRSPTKYYRPIASAKSSVRLTRRYHCCSLDSLFLS